jgi:hypothetical protein
MNASASSRKQAVHRRAVAILSWGELMIVPPLGQRLRRKEWDFYGVTTRDHYVAIVIAHAGYVGVVAAQWIDLAAGRVVVERAGVTPLGLGVHLGNASGAGAIRYGFRSTRLAIDTHADGTRRIDGAWGDLAIELELGPAIGVENVASLAGGRGVYHNHKIPALPARGTIALGARRVALEDAFATLDWGRGVWPYRTSWRWAAAQGRLRDGRTIGLTLGDVSADPGEPREDAVIVGGALTKLAPVRFDFDHADAMRPWRFTNERIDLTLAPRVDNGRRANLGVASARLLQAIGTISGTVRTDAGETITVDAIPGWAEELHARW